MKGNQSLGEVDRNILDIISHYGSLTFLDLWYEIGEDYVLKEQIMTKEELSRKLEFFVAQGYVESVKDSEGSTRWALKKERKAISDSILGVNTSKTSGNSS